MGSLRARLLARYYDASMQRSEKLCLAAWRAELLAQAKGDVLEIGAGTGVNLPHYPAAIKQLFLSEPDPHMRRQLSCKLTKYSDRTLQTTDWDAAQIDLPDHSLDTVVSTLVLCSVTDPLQSLNELYRLLRPGGQLLFLEHIAAEQPGTLRWQKLFQPLWKYCCGNCHLTRDTKTTLVEAGFQIGQLQEADLLGAPAIVRRTIRGCAQKPESDG